MSDRTPGSVEGLYQQLACERAGRARATLAQELSVERLFAESAQALEDAAGRAASRRDRVHRDRRGRCRALFAEQAARCLAVGGPVRGGGRPERARATAARRAGRSVTAVSSLSYRDADGVTARGRGAPDARRATGRCSTPRRRRRGVIETLDGHHRRPRRRPRRSRATTPRPSGRFDGPAGRGRRPSAYLSREEQMATATAARAAEARQQQARGAALPRPAG